MYSITQAFRILLAKMRLRFNQMFLHWIGCDAEALIVTLLVQRGELSGLDLVEMSNGALKRGTIYVTLDWMENNGIVKSRIVPDSRHRLNRRVYSLA